jgi:hypothetical protein
MYKYGSLRSTSRLDYQVQLATRVAARLLTATTDRHQPVAIGREARVTPLQMAGGGRSRQRRRADGARLVEVIDPRPGQVDPDRQSRVMSEDTANT